MIQSLSIKNFLSFKDEVTISFKATKDDHLEDYHVVEVAPGVRLLKFLVLYGYNASGKSNLIHSFDFLNDFWFDSKDNKSEQTGIIPFMLDKDSKNKPSEFSMTFYINSVKHKYFLAIDKNVVWNERLDFYPGTRPANIFDRANNKGVSDIKFGSKLKVAARTQDEINLKCLPNMSVFAAFNQVNASISGLDKVINWIRSNFLEPIDPQTKLQYFVENMIYSDLNCKERILNYLQRADFNVANINTEEIENKVTDDMLSTLKSLGAPKTEIERLEKERSYKSKKTEFEHTVISERGQEKYSLPIDLQSEGTKRIFGLSGALYKALEQDGFLAIDEIESKLHPHLIEYIIEEFLRESEQSQLIVATHYDNLFDQDDLLRKDNFWFTEKGKDGATKLYPLSAFKGLNRISSLQKAYKFGKFGAVPDIEE